MRAKRLPEKEVRRIVALIEESTQDSDKRDALTLRLLNGSNLVPRRRFIQDNFKIEDKVSGRKVLLKYNPVQRDLEAWQLRCERKKVPKRAFILKSRHHGVSTFFLAQELELVIRGELVKACIIAHDDDTAQTLLDAAKLMRDDLPWSLPHKFDNRSIVYFDEPIRGWIDVLSAQSGKRIRTGSQAGRSTGAGRGKHYRSQHFSEIAFYPDPQAMFTNLAQNMPEDPDTSVTLETTANGAGGWVYDFFWKTWEGKTDFAGFFFPWTRTPDLRRSVSGVEKDAILQTLDDEEKVLVAKLGADFEQLAWRRWAIVNKCGGSLDIFHQEYPVTPMESFISSGQPAFNHARLSKTLLACEDPIWRGRIIVRKRGREFELSADSTGPLKIWAYPTEGKRYVMGSDTAGGGGRGTTDPDRVRPADEPDNSAVVICEAATGCQVATWADNTVNPEEFGRLLACLGRHYNNAYALPEVNPPGNATLEAMIDLDYPHILCQPIYGKAGQVVSRRMGWKTRGESKYLLTREIHADLSLADEDQIHIIDEDLVGELFACQQDPKESFSAPKGSHDDRVISYALCRVALRMVFEQGIEVEPPLPPRDQNTYEREEHWRQFEEQVEDQTGDEIDEFGEEAWL